MESAPTASGTRTSATTTSRAEHYDSKWGINYDERRPGAGHGQAAQGARARAARASRARSRSAPGTGYFSLNLLRAGVVGEAVATDISPGMLEGCERSAEELGAGRRDGRLRGLGAAVRGRLLRPRLRPRRAAPPARPRRRVPRVPARAAARRRGGVLRRALPLRRPDRGLAQARRARGGAAVAGADGRRAAAVATGTATAAAARRTGSSRWWTCTRSRPRELPGHAGGGRLRATCA